MLLDFHALQPLRLQLLHGGHGVVPVIPGLHNLYAKLRRQAQNKPLHKAVVNHLLAAGKATALLDELGVIHPLFATFHRHPVAGQKPPYLGVHKPLCLGEHGHGGVVLGEGQIQPQPHPAAPPERRVLRPAATLYLVDGDVSLRTQALVHDVVVLAQVIFPLVLVENGGSAQVPDGLKDVLIAYRHRVGLVDHKVVGFPVLFQPLVRLVEQRKDVFPVAQAVQHPLGLGDLVQQDVAIVGVLGGDDNAQLIHQGNLGGAHGLHRVGVQRPRLVRQKDVGQPPVHPVVGVGQRGVFAVVDQTDNPIPVDLEVRLQGRGDLDNFPHGQT